MIKYVALTGGIGSGKSVVAKIFNCLGIPVYDSDSRAKILMNTDEELKAAITFLVGDKVYCDGVFQKEEMAKAIFAETSLCHKVNAIVHPRVWIDYTKWSAEQDAPFTIMETALLYESDLYKKFDKTICVIADEKLRLERVMKRNGVDAISVCDRMKNQSSLHIANKKSDYIIENNSTFVIPQVMTIYEHLKEL